LVNPEVKPMVRNKRIQKIILAVFFILSLPGLSQAWYDNTHLAIAKVAGYPQWYNAAGPDIAKIKAGDKEARNHYSNNSLGSVITPQMILDQVARYDDPGDEKGHLYGAIVASLRDYKSAKAAGKYAVYYLSYCVHYVGDLSMPLHNTIYNSFNRRNHGAMDGAVDDEVLDHLERIKVYPIKIQSEDDLIKEIARIANLSLKLGYQLEAENRNLTKEEGYLQLGHSASLFKAILDYIR
jgi:hypothetical protein